jgi:hypothetical protein
MTPKIYQNLNNIQRESTPSTSILSFKATSQSTSKWGVRKVAVGWADKEMEGPTRRRGIREWAHIGPMIWYGFLHSIFLNFSNKNIRRRHFVQRKSRSFLSIKRLGPIMHI